MKPGRMERNYADNPGKNSPRLIILFIYSTLAESRFYLKIQSDDFLGRNMLCQKTKQKFHVGIRIVNARVLHRTIIAATTAKTPTKPEHRLLFASAGIPNAKHKKEI